MEFLVTQSNIRVQYCNIWQLTLNHNRDKNDTANYLVFIQELRKALDAKYSSIHKLITVAVGTNPFNDAKQTPMAKLDKNWASAVDSFYIMVITLYPH